MGWAAGLEVYKRRDVPGRIVLGGIGGEMLCIKFGGSVDSAMKSRKVTSVSFSGVN